MASLNYLLKKVIVTEGGTFKDAVVICDCGKGYMAKDLLRAKNLGIGHILWCDCDNKYPHLFDEFGLPKDQPTPQTFKVPEKELSKTEKISVFLRQFKTLVHRRGRNMAQYKHDGQTPPEYKMLRDQIDILKKHLLLLGADKLEIVENEKNYLKLGFAERAAELAAV